MAAAGINPYNRSTLSYKIVIDSKNGNTSYEERVERWVADNPLLSLVATVLFFGSIR